MADHPQWTHLIVDGQHFVVKARRDDPGAYDFAWLSGPNDGYGFSSKRSNGAAMSEAEMREAIRNFLAQVDPRTGYIPD